MKYVGMDVSSKSFVIHAIEGKNKKIVFRGEVEPSEGGLRKMLLNVGEGKKKVVLEAGNQTKWIFDYLKKQKSVTVHVVHPNEVKWISQSSGKTDKVDARKLAELARIDALPRAVHMVEGETRKLRELISARGQLQSKRVALINTLRGFLKQEGCKLPGKFFERADWRETVKKMRMSEVLKFITEQLVESIEALKASEVRLEEELLKISDERIEKAESVPGLGKFAARVMVSALDDAKRFDNKKCVANYAALTPTIYQSGNETHHGKINRDGRHEVRKTLLQCAHAVMRTKNEEAKPLREFCKRIEKRRGKKRAIVALARKLATTTYGVLKTESFYEPSKLSAWS